MVIFMEEWTKEQQAVTEGLHKKPFLLINIMMIFSSMETLPVDSGTKRLSHTLKKKSEKPQKTPQHASEHTDLMVFQKVLTSF